MHEIPQLSGKLNQRWWQTRLRVNNKQRQKHVKRACKLIFVKGYAIEGENIETLLKEGSLISLRVKKYFYSNCLSSTHFILQNAFSVWLSNYKFDFHSMVASDILHEFELGVFLAVFKHALCLLYAAANNSIQKLNKWSSSFYYHPQFIDFYSNSRFWNTPTFGCNTIWKFSNDTAAMKKMATRDYEDILQISFN